MLNKIKTLIIKYRELILYVIFGGLTTLVDFGVYILMTDIFGFGEVSSNTVAWAAAVVFAFITNKLLVFEDRKRDVLTVLYLFITFAGMRAASWGLSTFSLWLFSGVYGVNDILVKAVTSVIVVILNYIFSKLIIFKKRRE